MLGALAVSGPDLGDLVHGLGAGAAILDDAGGVSLSVKDHAVAGGDGGLDHLGLELALDLLDACLLDIHFRRGACDEEGDLGELLGGEGGASGLGVEDSSSGFGAGDLDARLELREHGLLAVGGGGDGGGRSRAGFRHARALHQLGGLSSPDGLEVALVVGDALDFEGVEDEAEGVEVLLGLLEEALREGVLVFVDLLRGEGGQHAAEVAFKGLAGEGDDLLARLTE